MNFIKKERVKKKKKIPSEKSCGNKISFCTMISSGNLIQSFALSQTKVFYILHTVGKLIVIFRKSYDNPKINFNFLKIENRIKPPPKYALFHEKFKFKLITVIEVFFVKSVNS